MKNHTRVFALSHLHVCLTFLIVPLLIKGLGVENYGVWVTIFSGKPSKILALLRILSI